MWVDVCHILLLWAPDSFWYMTFQPRVAGVCQLFLDNEESDGIDPLGSDSSQGPPGRHASLYPLLPHRSSACPSVD